MRSRTVVFGWSLAYNQDTNSPVSAERYLYRFFFLPMQSFLQYETISCRPTSNTGRVRTMLTILPHLLHLVLIDGIAEGRAIEAHPLRGPLLSKQVREPVPVYLP